jgi:glycosyltransferase involved in cell wall biosynthesis
VPAPKFSIVTPSLNQCSYIEATIRSVISQEGDFEIEYFIMDGGSSDGSIDVIRRYSDLVNEGRFPPGCNGVHIHWASEKDSGQSDAINKGLRRASGDFAAYINSDDVYLPNAFSTVAAAFRHHRAAAFIYGDGDVIDEQGKMQWEWLSRPYNHGVMLNYHFLWNDFTNYILQQATFWRCDVHRQIGLFDESLHFAMDLEYWVRAGEKGLTLLHVPVKLAGFRMIQGTKSLSGPSVFWPDHLEIYRKYLGARKLQAFLARYYFNLSKHNHWDLDAARAEADRSLTRWATVSANEKAIILRQSARAEGVAALLIADELQRQGDYARACEFIRRGCKHLPSVVGKPTGFYPILKHLIGPRRAAALDRQRDKWVAEYKKNKFDYRYHQKREPGAS